MSTPTLLNINNYHYRRGGAEVVYLDHGDLFSEMGWSVRWFSMKHPSNPVGTDERYFAELIDLEHFSGAAEKLRAGATIIYNRQARRQMKLLLDESTPDIAHFHNIYHHLSPSILDEIRLRGIPIVMTAHDLKLACPSYKMLSNGRVCERCKGGRVWNLALHRCLKGSFALSSLITVESALHKSLGLYSRSIDRIVAPSQFYKGKLAEWGWPDERIVHIPNWVRTPGDRPPAGGGGPILYFGRLTEEKGLITLIRAAARAGVAVTIAGSGPMSADLAALAQHLSAPVTFVGHLSGSVLSDLVRSAAATVLPSEWYENGPMSLLESYVQGRPVAGANIGGIPELIRSGETGWLFEPGDVNGLASLLERIAATPADALSEFGGQGWWFVKEQFDPYSYRNSMLTLYDELL